MFGDDVSAVVVDVGSCTSRFGYAGEDCPKISHPSVIAVGDNMDSMKKARFPLNPFVCLDKMDIRPLMSTSPLGDEAEWVQTLDSDVFEVIVEKSIVKGPAGLGVEPSNHPFLLTEPTRHNTKLRQKMAEVMFEKFSPPALFLAKQAVLTGFANGRSSALILDIGASQTTCTPIYDGYALQKNLKEAPVGGDFLDLELLEEVLAQTGREVTPHFQYKKRVQMPDPETDPDGFARIVSRREVDMSSVESSYRNWARMEVVREMKETMCSVAESEDEAERPPVSAPSNVVEPYTLPDGTEIQPGPYMYTIAERLFRPSLFKSKSLKGFNGLPKMICNTILGSDTDLRKDLLSAVIITGGSSYLRGLSERVTRSLHAPDLIGASQKFKIIAPSSGTERKFSAWIGGSILASLGSFHQMWISKQEYEEHGLAITERKCP
uniref:Actin-related protein 4 n=1 Tax=Chromera velia CCMP2878 TaxID=1169474 RepID=A0A0G4IEM5_9ALVE|eukprot:Cvel_13747.t1-p1 / transcript=Cvel_13747.t1 / gene=Cvel_13747 / organism=Chromera_velia_CCMP2878 / gene_product=Actin-related protein 4, putative / transcript_product=Actin-related protein 4, putative / location=Cvel_scaffold951:50848-52149(+) / protein_length=434 / sequence_SO=supercontig / SO=protein_coding / is_pseudo=false